MRSIGFWFYHNHKENMGSSTKNYLEGHCAFSLVVAYCCLTAAKRKIKDFPKSTGCRISFMRGTLYAMLCLKKEKTELVEKLTIK